MKVHKERPNIVSVQLSPEGKGKLDDVCAKRGMSIKTLLGRLIVWFVDLDKTEQSIVLGQVEDADMYDLAELLKSRIRKPAAASRKSKAPRRRRASK